MFALVKYLAQDQGCFNHLQPPHIGGGQLSSGARLYTAAIVADALLSLTALAIGIIGILGILQGMPAGVSYALFGVSGVITLTWIIQAIATGGNSVDLARRLLIGALQKNPKNDYLDYRLHQSDRHGST